MVHNVLHQVNEQKRENNMKHVSLSTIQSINPALVSTAVSAIEKTPFDFQGLAIASRGDAAKTLWVDSFEVTQDGEIARLEWAAGGQNYFTNINSAFL